MALTPLRDPAVVSIGEALFIAALAVVLGAGIAATARGNDRRRAEIADLVAERDAWRAEAEACHE